MYIIVQYPQQFYLVCSISNNSYKSGAQREKEAVPEPPQGGERWNREIRGSQTESPAAVCSVRPEKPRQWSCCSSTVGGVCVCVSMWLCVGAWVGVQTYSIFRFAGGPPKATVIVLLNRQRAAFQGVCVSPWCFQDDCIRVTRSKLWEWE